MALEGISLLLLSGLMVAYIALLHSRGLIAHRLTSRDRTVYTQKIKHRYPFFDTVKGLAIIAVVIIHAPLLIEHFGSELPEHFLHSGEYINRIMRFAIPFFFISSGALLELPDLDVSSLKRFWLPKLKRIGIPYALFSLLAVTLTMEETGTVFQGIKRTGEALLTGNALIPYWFIPVLFQLYLIYPLIWYLIVKRKTDIYKLLASSFAFSLISYFLFSSYWHNWQSHIGDLTFMGSFLFLFVLGIALRPLFFSESRARVWLKSIDFPYFFLVLILAYIVLFPVNPLHGFYNVRLIYGPVLALGLFYFYPYVAQIKPLEKGLSYLGRESLYIYLLHFGIMTVTAEIIFLSPLLSDLSPYLLFAVLFFSGLFLSQGLVVIVRNMVNSFLKTVITN